MESTINADTPLKVKDNDINLSFHLLEATKGDSDIKALLPLKEIVFSLGKENLSIIDTEMGVVLNKQNLKSNIFYCSYFRSERF
jgi:hypothetical protein